MTSITFFMLPVALVMALAEWLKADHGIDIAAMIEEWALANPEVVGNVFDFINKAVETLENFFLSI